ncbi:hypothetical protein Nepgr_030997 [Nepenthes gracilis]|uniref:Uncharacterized protein n=1 Tax=Nepenthes gracilis TaxID=150966 RepID=A0AAD3TH86_NEPGR|nr:hypothetical protein Nepgr_030997 [Nepenthes gracilis]
MQFSPIKSHCSSFSVALSKMHGENEKFPFNQPFGNANCLYTDEKLQESKGIDDFQGALPSNKKLLLKSVNPSASRLANHLCNLYGARDFHYGHVQSISGHGQVSNSHTFSLDPAAEIHDACPILRRVDVMKSKIENGPNGVQLVSSANSSCDLSFGFEMTIKIPSVRNGKVEY